MRDKVEEFNVQFLNVVHYRPKLDSRIILLQVLKGEVSVAVECGLTRTLAAGDIHVINRNVCWQLQSQCENIVTVMHISPLWLFHSQDTVVEWYFQIGDKSASWVIRQLHNLMLQVVTLWLKKSSETWLLEINKLLLEIFCLLIQHFKSPPPLPPASGFSPRINKVVGWINENYHENITLQHIASRLHVSVAHLSRQFVHETGMNFRALLTRVRLRHAVREIALTDRPIGQIVSDNGFSSMRRFSLLFRQRYGMTPGEYRKCVKTLKIVPEAEPELLSEGALQTGKIDTVELFSLLSHRPDNYLALPKWGSQLKTVDLHLQSKQTSSAQVKRHRYVIAVGSFEELLRHHVQQQLEALTAQVPLYQLDIGDPLCGNLFAHSVRTGELVPTWSPWINLDLVTNFICRLGVSPLIRLSPFNSQLTFDEHLMWLKAFIDHNILLLGRGFVQRWSFILDIEPTGNVHLQDLIARSTALLEMIRSTVPGCKTGLSCSQLFTSEGYARTLVSSGIMRLVDFIGISVAPNAGYDFSSDPASVPQENDFVIREQLDGTLRLLKRYGIQREIYLQSWSTLTGNTLRINGLFFRGALLMNTLLSLPEEIGMLGFWLNSELQNEVSDHYEINNDSLSLFFCSTTRRPVFHILALKAKIKNALFAAGPGWLASRDEETYTIMLLNPVTVNPLLSVEQHLLNDYVKRFSVKFEVNDPGIWRIKQWVFDQKNGALYYQYGLHPTQYDRDEETMNYISRRSEPTLSVRDERISRFWTQDIVLDINAVCLLELRRIA